jgi:hypothetical protein
MTRRFELVCDESCPASCHAICYGKTKEEAVNQLIDSSTFCDRFNRLNTNTFTVLSESEIDLTLLSPDKACELFGKDNMNCYKHVIESLQVLIRTAEKQAATDVSGVEALNIINYNAIVDINSTAKTLLSRLESMLATRVERC